MADDDEARDETSDPTSAPVTPRRSTYTPPAEYDGSRHDDDALADALAAEFERLSTGTIPLAPAADLPSPRDLQPVAADLAPESEPTPAEPTPVEDAASASASAPAPEPAPPTATIPVWNAPPAWSSLPAPDPAQAVSLPEPDRPVRRSLPDEQLAQWVENAGSQSGNTLEVIEQLETQLRLRDDEARAFGAWEQRMRALGTPDAIAAVEQARPEFSGLVPGSASPGPSVPAPPAPSPSAEFFSPEPAPEPVAEPEGVVPPEAEGLVSPEPEIDAEPVIDFVPVFDAESVVNAEPVNDAEPVTSEEPPIRLEPEVGTEPEAETESAPVELAHEAEAEAEPLPEIAPDPELQPEPEPALWPAFEWAPPAPTAAPSFDEILESGAEPVADDDPDVYPIDSIVEVEPDPSYYDPFDDASVVEAVVEPEPEPLVEPAAEPELAIEPESSPEPEPQPTRPPFAPPALVEPSAPVEPLALGEPQALVEPQALIEPPTFVEPQTPVEPPALIEPTLAAPISAPLSPFDAALAGDGVDEEPEPRAFDFRQGAPLPPATTASALAFDALLGDTGDDAEEPPLHPDQEPDAPEDAAPEALFIEPMSFAAGAPVPTDTGSISVIDQAYEEELDDDVDETDRIVEGVPGLVPVAAAGAAAAQPIAPPSEPISTMRIPEEESVFYNDEPVAQPVFSLEASGTDATPVDQRVGRAARLFWLWFAANSSILSLGLGAAVFAVGLSLRQSIVAVLAGVALSFIPLGLTTLAGKRSGQPTMVVSRATFGLLGNVLPSAIALLTRLFWGAVLLWLLASSVAVILVGADLSGSLSERQLLLICLAIAFIVALLVAFAGYPLLARVQLILSCISAVLVVGLIALTAQYIDIPQALTAPDGPWLLTITGAVLVFSFVGLVWANSGADLARYQRPGSSGASSMLWATFGTTLPTFLLIAYGALLAASDRGIASGFLASPLDTLALMLPSWYPIPLVAATTLSLLSGIIITIYSGGFALQAIGVRVKRQWSIVIVGVLLGMLALLISFGVVGGVNELFRDAATTLAVPTAAWAGIFAAETMIRNRRFESQSLVRRGGVYADVRWVNQIALVVVSVIGFALTSATVTWLSWQGYGFTLLGIPLTDPIAGTDVGVLVALALGLIVPIATGIPAIRRQEAARV